MYYNVIFFSVRNSTGGIVQFLYGDDGLDPTNIEGKGIPVEPARVLQHVINIFPSRLVECRLELRFKVCTLYNINYVVLICSSTNYNYIIDNVQSSYFRILIHNSCMVLRTIVKLHNYWHTSGLG